MTKLFLAVFLLISLQTFMGVLQIRAYQREIKKLAGTGVLGIGFRKGFIGAGEIIILCYDRAEGKVAKCRRLRGRTVFSRFKNAEEYEGLRLSELRGIADAADKKRREKIFKTKGVNKSALSQATEAIETRLEKERNKEV